MATADTKQFTDQNFDPEVRRAPEVVLVDFWAPWCGPCRAFAPTLDALASDLRGRAKVGKLNVDENPEISKQYGIRSIPTLLVFKGGRVVDTLVGSAAKSRILSMVDRHLVQQGSDGVQSGLDVARPRPIP